MAGAANGSLCPEGPRLSSADQTPAFFERLGYSLLNGFATATTAVLLLALVVLLGYSVGAAVCVALGFGLGTLAWPYATYDFSEPTAALFLVAGTTAIYAARRHPQLGTRAGRSPLAPRSSWPWGRNTRRRSLFR